MSHQNQGRFAKYFIDVLIFNWFFLIVPKNPKKRSQLTLDRLLSNKPFDAAYKILNHSFI